MSLDSSSENTINSGSKVKFTLLSTATAALSIAFMVITYRMFSNPQEAQLNSQPGLLPNLLYPLFTITGLIFTYLSFKNSEGLGFLKWMSACYHVFCLVTYGGILLFFLARYIG